MLIDAYPEHTEQLLSEICHDLHEPVESIRATTAAARADPGLSSQLRRRLKQIEGQVEWLARMIQDCLGTACQGETDGTGNRPTNVVCVVNEAVAACSLTWPGEMSVTSPAGPALCALHPVVLRRVISNVLSNATRAAGPSGVVTVEINRSQGMTVLMVEDSGPGFGMIPHGYGIGLAEVARNVIRNGGKLECDRGTSGGARVSLWLA